MQLQLHNRNIRTAEKVVAVLLALSALAGAIGVALGENFWLAVMPTLFLSMVLLGLAPESSRRHKIVHHIDVLLTRLQQWILRNVLCAVRAFLAGAGAGAIIGLIGSVASRPEPIESWNLFAVVLAGGLVGVACQRLYRRAAFLRRVSDWLSMKANVIEELD